ncbi:uncharacterized protein KNAG_0K01930 [Huiozyma naganishii CBS 8797]|uniref:Uncharacterized protein n=1 Tax=Huiozyma naganishii (strain ATCC MYA-139 / BCRC 22969 / CBS 8797 / KCTC 17520 / NBRC 10181 / NCYC 3082 / Yp74L-3) TaxID=1071383 RepID=J7S3E3_HUIN7|nr:hypothetical protein KNAG_0K01930 [Kazachstania naganishii CBS 8797]CCK72557.1 hypothetical protein KNAG_0K01930 [Kazachstania naganishii CBS 8797]
MVIASGRVFAPLDVNCLGQGRPLAEKSREKRTKGFSELPSARSHGTLRVQAAQLRVHSSKTDRHISIYETMPCAEPAPRETLPSTLPAPLVFVEDYLPDPPQCSPLKKKLSLHDIRSRVCQRDKVPSLRLRSTQSSYDVARGKQHLLQPASGDRTVHQFVHGILGMDPTSALRPSELQRLHYEPLGGPSHGDTPVQRCVVCYTPLFDVSLALAPLHCSETVCEQCADRYESCTAALSEYEFDSTICEDDDESDNRWHFSKELFDQLRSILQHSQST